MLWQEIDKFLSNFFLFFLYMKRVHIIVSGEVNGIYFRSFIKDRAIELGLVGYARNVPVRKVEVMVEGHEAKIDKLIELCKQGPRGAVIDNIKATTLPFKGEFKTFKIIY